MSESSLVTIRQCPECRRIHSLGTCFYGISNGKITKFPKGHKGNDSIRERPITFLKRSRRNFKLKYFMSEHGYKKIKGAWVNTKLVRTLYRDLEVK